MIRHLLLSTVSSWRGTMYMCDIFMDYAIAIANKKVHGDAMYKWQDLYVQRRVIFYHARMINCSTIDDSLADHNDSEMGSIDSSI